MILLVSGVLLVAGARARGSALWSDPSPSGNGQFAGAFVFLVLGIPAVGFCIVATVFGTLLTVLGKPAQTTGPVVEGAYTPAPSPGWHRRVSIAGFWIAALWTVPYGFLATVALVTSDLQNLFVSLLTWGAVAGPAFAAHLVFKPTR